MAAEPIVLCGDRLKSEPEWPCLWPGRPSVDFGPLILVPSDSFLEKLLLLGLNSESNTDGLHFLQEQKKPCAITTPRGCATGLSNTLESTFADSMTYSNRIYKLVNTYLQESK